MVLSDLEPLPDVAATRWWSCRACRIAPREKIERKVTRWIADAARGGAHIASVCTGAFVLGEAGLLDGRRCTTHWSRTAELARRFPRARVLDDRLYVTDGEITTSAGIASGIDMALAFIEQADGPIVAAEVAREMVVYLRRDGAPGTAAASTSTTARTSIRACIACRTGSCATPPRAPRSTPSPTSPA